MSSHSGAGSCWNVSRLLWGVCGFCEMDSWGAGTNEANKSAPGVVEAASSSASCCPAHCSLPTLPVGSSAQPLLSGFISVADLNNHTTVLLRHFSSSSAPMAAHPGLVLTAERGTVAGPFPGAACDPLSPFHPCGGSSAWLQPFLCVCVSLRQMRLKKETGGIEVECSHEKK